MSDDDQRLRDAQQRQREAAYRAAKAGERAAKWQYRAALLDMCGCQSGAALLAGGALVAVAVVVRGARRG